jgi:hypothetical protein
MKYFVFVIISFIVSLAYGQSNGKVEGNVLDKNTLETISGATIAIDGTSFKTLSNEDGHYLLELPTGTYNLTIKSPGYLPLTKYNIAINSGATQIVNFEISPVENELDELIVTENKGVKADATDMVTPLSVQRLTSEEVKSNPGGNYDVSKVVQTLPGVGGSFSGGRNDIIVRGGAPNENVYYLDGIEIPVLNHFQTQGSSGGAQGIVNVSFIDELKLSSSAFDARYDNALASTFVIKQRQGNSNHFSGNARTGLTETALTLEGPLGKKTDFLAAGRISYLDFLFKLIDLPIRPRYQDYQLNVTTKINAKTTLKFIGLGAIDKFNFGATRDSSAENEYFRRSLPFIEQWNYTTGLTLRRQISKGYINVALSRNMFNNQLDRFTDANYGNEAYRNFGLTSQEMENKLRADINKFVNGWKISAGVSMQYVKYSTDIYNKLAEATYDSTGTMIQPAIEIKFKSAIDFAKMGAFTQVSKSIINDRLLVSAGIRTDMNTFTTNGMNPLSTLSPRLSLAYSQTSKLTFTGSIGSYYKIPTYTVLGYRNNANVLVNQSVDYIHSVHYVLGTQYLPNPSFRITLEGFYKNYSNYPVSVTNGISLANQGQEFGSVGNEAVTSTGIGKSYGFEVFVQQKLIKKIFYFISYTYVRSKFSGADGKLLPSAWDNQHLLSGTFGYKFGKNWQLGAKYRLAGGLPYTPFNMVASQQNFALLGTGTLDYSKVNSERLKLFQQLDLRIDKTWNLNKISFIGFIDIQNITGSKQQGTPYYTFKRNADNSGYATTDGQPLKQDGSNGIPVILKNESTTVVPTLGLIIQF